MRFTGSKNMSASMSWPGAAYASHSKPPPSNDSPAAIVSSK